MGNMRTGTEIVNSCIAIKAAKIYLWCISLVLIKKDSLGQLVSWDQQACSREIPS